MNVRITDIDGKKPSFVQWDVDRVLYIEGTDSQPCLHFANPMLTRAIVVEAEADGSRWSCQVPNIILQYDAPIVISVFVQPDEGKTVLTDCVKVQPKMKPQDYTFEENIGYTNWVQKTQEAEELLATLEETCDQAQDLVEDIQGKLERKELQGNSIWTTTETPAPATGGVAFTQLTGRSAVPPIVGDIIIRSSRYVYDVVEVTSGGVVIGHLIGDIKGEQGVADAIWRTTAMIGSVYPSGYVVSTSNLVGRTGVSPKAGDLVIGPEADETGDPSYLYVISRISGSSAWLDSVGSIKGATGATGPQGPGVTEDLRAALLQLAQKVAYVDEHGADYYQDLYNALYLPSDIVFITAVFNQGTTTVMDTDSLDSLKPMLTVFGRYDDNTSVVLANYTLTGVLTPGTSTVTVSALGKTTTFDVFVTGITSISAVYTPGQDTPKSIDPTRINAYVNADGAWVSSSDSYSVCVPVTVGKQYNLHFSTTDSSLVGTFFRVGFTDANTPSGQSLSGVVRSTPQNLSNLTETATGQYLVVQLPSAVASDVITNGYLTLTELARIIYDTDTLDSIKANLVVTAVYSDSSTQTVPSADYTLSGTLTAGTSTILVAYGGKTTTFSVTVVVNGWLYHFNQSLLSSGSDDFGFTGVEKYAVGAHGDDYAYWHDVETEGTYSTDLGAIVVYNVGKVPDLSADFTISFWYKSFSQSRGTHLSAYNTNSGASGNYTNSGFGDGVIDAEGWSISYADLTKKHGGIRIRSISTGGIDLLLSDVANAYGRMYKVAFPSSFDTTIWHHYALTRKDGVMRFFVDGVQIMHATVSSAIKFADQVSLGSFWEFNAPTTLSKTSYGNCYDDFYVAEWCKWDSDFDPETIVY